MNGFDIKKPYLEHTIPLGQCRDIYGVCFLMELNIPIIMSMTLIHEVGEALVFLFSFFCNNTP